MVRIVIPYPSSETERFLASQDPIDPALLVRLGRIQERAQFFFGRPLYAITLLPYFVGEGLAVFRDVFKNNFVELHQNRVDVAGKSIPAHT
jgi:hypothetical protein